MIVAYYVDQVHFDTFVRLPIVYRSCRILHAAWSVVANECLREDCSDLGRDACWSLMTN